jgi:hypothetical protein
MLSLFIDYWPYVASGIVGHGVLLTATKIVTAGITKVETLYAKVKAIETALETATHSAPVAAPVAAPASPGSVLPPTHA